MQVGDSGYFIYLCTVGRYGGSKVGQGEHNASHDSPACIAVAVIKGKAALRFAVANFFYDYTSRLGSIPVVLEDASGK